MRNVQEKVVKGSGYNFKDTCSFLQTLDIDDELKFRSKISEGIIFAARLQSLLNSLFMYIMIAGFRTNFRGGGSKFV